MEKDKKLLEMKSLLKKGGDKIDAITDWNALILLVGAEINRIKDILERLDSEFVTQEEFLEYKVYLNSQMAIYNQFMEEVNSYDLENFIPETNFTLIDLQQQIDLINSQLEIINDIIGTNSINVNAYYKIASGFTTETYNTINNLGTIFPSYDVDEQDSNPYGITATTISLQYMLLTKDIVSKNIEIEVYNLNTINLEQTITFDVTQKITISQVMVKNLLPRTSYNFKLLCDGEELAQTTTLTNFDVMGCEGNLAITGSTDTTLTVDVFYKFENIDDGLEVQLFKVGTVGLVDDFGLSNDGTMVDYNDSIVFTGLESQTTYVVKIMSISSSGGDWIFSTAGKTTPLVTGIENTEEFSTYKIDIAFDKNIVINENFIEFLSLKFNGLHMINRRDDNTKLYYQDYFILDKEVNNNIVSYIILLFQQVKRSYVISAEALYNGLAVDMGFAPLVVANTINRLTTPASGITYVSKANNYKDSFLIIYQNGMMLTEYYDYTLEYKTDPNIRISLKEETAGTFLIQEQYR